MLRNVPLSLKQIPALTEQELREPEMQTLSLLLNLLERESLKPLLSPLLG